MSMNQPPPLRSPGFLGGVASIFGGFGRGISKGAKKAATVTGGGVLAAGRVIGGTNRVNGIYTPNGKYFVMNSRKIKPFIKSLPLKNNRDLWNAASTGGKVITLKEFIKFLNPNNKTVNSRKFTELTLQQAVRNALAAKHARNNNNRKKAETNRLALAGNLYAKNGLTNTQRNAFIRFINESNSNLKAAEQYKGSTSLKHFLHKLAPNKNGIEKMNTRALKTAIVEALHKKANARELENAAAKKKASENAAENARHQEELLTLMRSRKKPVTANPVVAANNSAKKATEAAVVAKQNVVNTTKSIQNAQQATAAAALARQAAVVANEAAKNGQGAIAKQAASVARQAENTAVNAAQSNVNGNGGGRRNQPRP